MICGDNITFLSFFNGGCNSCVVCSFGACICVSLLKVLFPSHLLFSEKLPC